MPYNSLLTKFVRAGGNIIKGAFNVALIFAFLSILTSVFIWWKDIATIFNYPQVYKDILSQATKELFQKEKEVNTMPLADIQYIQLVPPANAVVTADNISEGTYTLSIPALNLTAPIYVSETTNPDYIQQLLKRGTVIYPSSLPGQEGTTVILGHSAPAGWPKINYDWVFGEIHQLKNGDIIKIFSPTESYYYRITKKLILKKGEDIRVTYATDSSSAIILLTCWPPGVDYKRIALQAELI